MKLLCRKRISFPMEGMKLTGGKGGSFPVGRDEVD